MEQKYLRILGIILVPLVIYLLSFGMIVFHYPYYEKLIIKYSANKEIAEKQTKNLIGYFQGKTELIGFTAKEAKHLKDVRWVIWLMIVILTAGTAALFFIRDEKAILYGAMLSLILPLALYILPFSLLFNYFHKIFFAPETWIFSYNSLLIQMYPFEFFYSFFKDILLRGFILGIVITITFSIDFVKNKL